MIRKLLCLLFFGSFAIACYAQNDDLMKLDSAQQDTSKNGQLRQTKGTDTVELKTASPIQPIDSYASRFNPRKASLYAAILPGAGQIYTRKYWKAPLVWGGFGLLVYAVQFSEVQYTHYRNELFQTINDPNVVLADNLTQTQLRTIVDQARRQRDYFLILNFFFYILQIVDAHVDAHLKEFDINPKLQVRLQTIPVQNGFLGRSAGIGLVYKIGYR